MRFSTSLWSYEVPKHNSNDESYDGNDWFHPLIIRPNGRNFSI